MKAAVVGTGYVGLVTGTSVPLMPFADLSLTCSSSTEAAGQFGFTSSASKPLIKWPRTLVASGVRR